MQLVFNYKSMEKSSPSSISNSNTTKRTFTFNTYITGLSVDNYFNTSAASVEPIVLDENHIQWTPNIASGYGNLSIVVYLIPGGKYKKVMSKNITQFESIALSFYESDGSYIGYIYLVNNDSEVTIPINAYYSIISVFVKQSGVGVTHTIEGSILYYDA